MLGKDSEVSTFHSCNADGSYVIWLAYPSVNICEPEVSWCHSGGDFVLWKKSHEMLRPWDSLQGRNRNKREKIAGPL